MPTPIIRIYTLSSMRNFYIIWLIINHMERAMPKGQRKSTGAGAEAAAAYSSSSGGGGGGTPDDSAEVLERIKKMIRPELPLEILERVNYKVLVKTTENQSSTAGRPETEYGKQADHSTAYAVLVYGITNPFYRVSTSIEEKRAQLYYFLKRLSVLAIEGSDKEALSKLITKIEEALTEYNDSRLLKRSENILNEVLSKTGIHLTDQLNKLQSDRIKAILCRKIEVSAEIRTMIPEIIRLFCEDDAPRTDQKEKELARQLLAVIDDEELKHDESIDKAVEIVSSIVHEVGLSYAQAYEHREQAAQRLRILKIRNLCQNVSAAGLEYYNHLRGIAFIQCPKVPVIMHEGNKKVLERDAIRSMNQRYLGKNRYNTGGTPLVVASLENEILQIKDAIDKLEEIARKKSKKSKSTSATTGGSSGVSAGSGAFPSDQQSPKKRVRMTGEFKKVRDQLKKQLELLQANLPKSVAKDIYGLLDYRKMSEYILCLITEKKLHNKKPDPKKLYITKEGYYKSYKSAKKFYEGSIFQAGSSDIAPNDQDLEKHLSEWDGKYNQKLCDKILEIISKKGHLPVVKSIDEEAATAGGGSAGSESMDEEAATTIDRGGAKASSKIGMRNNDKETLYPVLARHLYLILTVYPQAGLQYGYDITYPEKNIRAFREAVLTPFFEWVCADWEIDDEADISEVTTVVLNQLKSLLKMEGDRELQNTIHSKRSSGNASEISDSVALSEDSDTSTEARDRQESDDGQEELVLPVYSNSKMSLK